MSPEATPPRYTYICDKVWSLRQTYREKLIRNQPRNLLFPPPHRGRRVDLLFVGISPNHFAPIRFGQDRQGVEDFARRFEYVSETGNENTGMHYDAYYGELLTFARRIDPRFGVWKQVERNESALLVEFTDCLHIATVPGDEDDIWRIFNRQRGDCSVWRQCKEILEAELLLYRPKVVIGNGRPPSDMLYEICADRSTRKRPIGSVLLNTRLGCNVHFSSFITRQQMDAPYLLRLVQQVKRFLPVDVEE